MKKSPDVAPRVAVLVLQLGIPRKIVRNNRVGLGLRHNSSSAVRGGCCAAELGLLSLPPQLLGYGGVGAFERDAGERRSKDTGSGKPGETSGSEYGAARQMVRHSKNQFTQCTTELASTRCFAQRLQASCLWPPHLNFSLLYSGIFPNAHFHLRVFMSDTTALSSCTSSCTSSHPQHSRRRD